MNIIITGASQGIGYEIVKYFGTNNKNRIIGISRSIDKLKTIENDLSPNIFKGIAFDLKNIFADGDKLISNIISFMPYVDILINNAGFLVRKPFEESTQSEIQETFTTNLFAPAELIRLLSPYMGKNNRSHIVNIGSMAGFQGSSKFAGISWYSVSKAAISCLTESLSVELNDKNIAVNCLALGAAQTEMLGKAFPGYKAPVQANEMAEFIANFATSSHQVMTGKVIPVAMTNP